MLSLDGPLNLEARGLDHSPLTRSVPLEIDPPSLKDNTGLVDRLVRAAARLLGLETVTFPLSLAGGLNDLYGSSGYRVSAAVHVEGRQGRVVSLRTGRKGASSYGLAVDLGSTTIVLALVDMEAPSVVDQLSLANPQIEYGSDILTRAHMAEKPEGLDRLVDRLRRAVSRGAADICRRNGLDPAGLTAATAAGNTAMTHFLLGLPLRTIIREPYVPVINLPRHLRAADIGIEIAPEAPVLVMPNKGAYLGGDLMAGAVEAGFARAEEPCLMVDVGTNAEMILGQKDWLVGAAGAAGPALEGGVARMGMVAGPGVIDQVRIDRRTGQTACRTIGDLPPRGICGSGLIDLLAELFLSGLMDFHGKLTLLPGDPRRAETDEGPAFVVVPGRETADGSPILFTEIEIDIMTRSKAAMYTILGTVLKSVGLTFDQIDRFFVAGTFGQYIDPRMAVAIGMVPDIPLDRFVPLGNSSLGGAVLALVSARARAEVMDVWRRLTYLEMNVNQELMNRFSAARFFPHTDRWRFPSVGTLIT
ncbi:MAG: DUF4445 domain-containing protein [Proteobacteria bacterium]|nr:DUF4445 domain-containing protein [Pseudomonadota bacterium]